MDSTTSRTPPSGSPAGPVVGTQNQRAKSGDFDFSVSAFCQLIREDGPALELDSFSPAGWEQIVQLAQGQGVAPLLYWTLSGSGKISSLPRQMQHSLRAAYFSTRMNNEQLLLELQVLTRRFGQAGIPVVALKGICFALTVYPDIGLRPMVDLDLLVPLSKHSAALRIARSLGYAEARPEASEGLDELLNHATCLTKTRTPFTTLELHTTLVAEESFIHAVPVDWFWSQTEPLDNPASTRILQPLRMLTPTAQLLYGCAHAMLQHGGRNTTLRWLSDLDRLIRAYGAARLDWALLLAQASVFEWGSAVFVALSQAVQLFDTPVPPEVLDHLSKQSDRNRKRVAMLQKPPATHVLEEYQKFVVLKGLARFKFTLALAIPGPAYMRWRYVLRSSWALPVWYLYRWWGILKDVIKTLSLMIQKTIRQGSHLGSPFDK